jgi:hypothetical protein
MEHTTKGTGVNMQTIAYIVRRTYFDSTSHEDVERFDVAGDFLNYERAGLAEGHYSNSYTEALECAYKVREEMGGSKNPVGYAVIDPVYADGVST